MNPPATPIKDALAAELRAQVARRRLPHADIAQALGVTPSAFSRKLSGQNPISVDELAVIARLLDTTADELIRVAQEASPPCAT